MVVQTVGEVAEGAREYARRQITAFVRRLRRRLNTRSPEAPSARIKLTVFTRPSGRLPALVQANLDVGGQAVRAQMAATFVHEASRRLRVRLGAQLARLTHPDLPRPWPAESRAELEPLTVPPGRREIVRHRSYRVGPSGYRFFRDRASAWGAVLYRRYDGHYGLITAGAGGMVDGISGGS